MYHTYTVCSDLADEDYSTQDQVIVYSHEGDGENTEHLNSMDLHDIKTELERDAEAEKAEVKELISPQLCLTG